jgi:hypothetical protein
MAREGRTMDKKGSLPKTFQKRLSELKRLDDELGITVTFFTTPTEKQIRERKKREEREQLLKEIWQNWPRKTLLDKDVMQMRGNALKNREVKAILEKTHTRIEDCALVDLRGEDHIGTRHDCPGNCSPEEFTNSLTISGWRNMWLSYHGYGWGGPKDPIKILFEQSGNYRYQCVGVIQMFSKDRERKVAA